MMTAFHSSCLTTDQILLSYVDLPPSPILFSMEVLNQHNIWEISQKPPRSLAKSNFSHHG